MRKVCRMCGGRKFKRVIDFGKNPLVNSLIEKERLFEKEPVYPLIVRQCTACKLVQLTNPISSEKIYTDQDYLYYSSDMPGLSEYFKEYANNIKKFLKSDNDLVVEIGSNDGILLKHLLDYKVLGVDPATNVVIRALRDGVPTLSAFFDKRTAISIKKFWGEANVISANNCIAHIDNLNDVMDGIKELLAGNGVFVLECNYWGGMVKNKNYSLIYHDHFSYFTLQNWVDYVGKYLMEVFDVEVTPAQGGSLRVYIGNKGIYDKTNRFQDLLEEEINTELNTVKTARDYGENIRIEANKLYELVSGKKNDGAKIAAYGAAAKGFSVLKLSGIDNKIIEYFVDDSPAKQWKYTPVTHIPIFSRKSIDDSNLPDYFIITAPNYEEVILKKEQKFIDNGGKFITVDCRIVEK